jgi:hypothetical protein
LKGKIEEWKSSKGVAVEAVEEIAVTEENNEENE